MNVVFCTFTFGGPGSALVRYLAFQNTNGAGGNWNSTETRVYVEIENPGVFSNLTTYISTNTGYTSGNNELITRLNATTNGNVVITWTTETGYVEDTSNTDSWDNDEKWCYRFTQATYSGTLTANNPSGLFAPTTGTFNIYTPASIDFNGTTTNQYFAINATTAGFSATQVNHQDNIPFASTLRDVWTNCDTNTRTGGANDELRSQVNGSNGNILITATIGVTGELEDLTNEDTLAEGDLVNIIFVAGAATTGRVLFRTSRIEILATNAFIFIGSYSSGTCSADTYMSPSSEGGRVNGIQDTENNQKIRVDVAFTWSDVWAYLSAYSLTGGSNQLQVRSRINGGSGNQVITFTGTGEQVDSSNTDTVASGDLINYFYDVTSTGGSVTARSSSSLATGSSTLVKTINGLAMASVSTFNGLAKASVKTVQGLSNV